MSEHVALTPSRFTLTDAAREMANGATAAVVLLALMLPLGLIAFGQEEAGVEAAVRAAMAAAIFGNLSALVLGAPLLPNELPRASTVFVFAAFTIELAREGATVPDILMLSAICLVLSGTIQVLFGLLRLGNVARFVPYPVIAGLMTGLAIKLIVYELPEMLGTHGGGGEHGGGGHHGINGWTLTLALFTMIVVIVVRSRWPNSPAKMVGIAAGTVLAVIVTALFAGDVGPHVPILGGEVPLPDALLPSFGESVQRVRQFAGTLFIAAPTIALVGSLDSLVAAVGEADGPLDTSHQPNRLLVALGLANIVSGAFGGVPLAYSSHHTLAAHRMDPVKILGSVATTLTLGALLLYGGPLLKLIPIAVLSGVMALLAFNLIDRWASAMLQRVRRRQYDRELWLNLLVVTVVAVMTAFGLVQAVITGILLSMLLFVAAMNRSLVRSVHTGRTRVSRRVYPLAHATVLREHGDRVRIIEIDGPIFFGTADRLATETWRASTGASFLILDLRRVTTIDASGALMLSRLKERLHAQGIHLLLAHLTPNMHLGQALLIAAGFQERHHADWFVDADRALEWAERQILQELVTEPPDELHISEFALMAGLSANEIETMKPYLDRQLFPSGAALFREGEAGDRLYLLARGAVSIVGEGGPDNAPHRRILTLAPGVMFGEAAILKQANRGATAIAEEESVTYSLSRRNFAAIRSGHYELYEKLLLNMLNHLSGLLRMTAGVVRESGDALE